MLHRPHHGDLCGACCLESAQQMARSSSTPLKCRPHCCRALQFGAMTWRQPPPPSADLAKMGNTLESLQCLCNSRGNPMASNTFTFQHAPTSSIARLLLLLLPLLLLPLPPPHALPAATPGSAAAGRCTPACGAAGGTRAPSAPTDARAHPGRAAAWPPPTHPPWLHHTAGHQRCVDARHGHRIGRAHVSSVASVSGGIAGMASPA